MQVWRKPWRLGLGMHGSSQSAVHDGTCAVSVQEGQFIPISKGKISENISPPSSVRRQEFQKKTNNMFMYMYIFVYIWLQRNTSTQTIMALYLDQCEHPAGTLILVEHVCYFLMVGCT